MVKISICIPVYNQIEFLGRTLESIKNQTFLDYEIIITDDSTNADVSDLISSFDFKEKLKYIHNLERLGSPQNWNKCIDLATGDYIKIMHHDDWFTSEDSLKQLYKTIIKEDKSFIFPNAEVIRAKSSTKVNYQPGLNNILLLKKNPNVLFYGNFIGAPSMTLYKRDPEIIFDNNLKWLVDVDFYIRYLKKHPDFSYLEKTLITIVSDAEHTVTTICEDDKKVLIYENFYLYNKLNKTLSLFEKIRMAHFLLSLTRRFNIISISEMKNLGVIRIPSVYFYIIFKLAAARFNLGKLREKHKKN